MSTIKIKFVNKGHVVTTYQWKPLFMFFGRWIPVANNSSTNPAECLKWMDKVDILAKYRKGEKLNNQNFWE